MRELRFFKSIISCLIFLSARPITAESINYIQLRPTLSSYKKEHFPSCRVHFLVDAAGKKYLVKQIKFDDNLSRLAKLTGEMVALSVGHALGVPLNTACIIPAGEPFVGKDTAIPATLHTHVPGTRFDLYQLRQRRTAYKGLDIHQKDPTGLSHRVIHHMARHKDLPAMAALDTFVGNADRGPNNFFYDKKTNSFYGIDMAGSFFRNLCGPSKKNIKKLLRDNKVSFTRQELKGLRTYYKTLKKLVITFEPDFLCELLDENALQAGFYDTTFFDTEVQMHCIRFLNRCKRIIQESYQDAIDLLHLLKAVRKKHEGTQ